MNKAIIDTNIILDILFMRTDFYEYSNDVIKLCEDKKLKGYVTTSSLMDIRYFIYKRTHDKRITGKAINEITKILNVIEINKDDIIYASNENIKDFEDSTIENCAIRNGFDYIITRNSKHVENKKIKVVSPNEYLSTIK